MIESENTGDIIAKYREVIPQRMQQEHVAGLAVVVVDDQNILWAEGFGSTDWSRKIPVTSNTLFSIQSMSKSFTATAVMFAIQDGLVDLDAPITTYLPDFHVNSIFEEHPEQKITLRMLLSHTAGFVHEAPYGNNFDHPSYSFEKHIASISDTWLKFPVGTRYSYSNLGIDLAGYILQARSRMPFIKYIQENVLDPVGMKNSMLDVSRIRDTSTRAIGYKAGEFLRPPVDYLLIPSGGVWTTAADMARYLQFHINKGALNGNRLLQEDLAETMYTPPSLAAQGAYQDSSYALGITVNVRNEARHFQHGGGGFGFNSSMSWYPELKLGAVVVCNTELQNDLVVQINEGILDEIIARAPEVYAQRAKDGVQSEPVYPQDEDDYVLPDPELYNLIVSKASPEDESTENRRKSYEGEYMVPGLDGTADFVVLNGELNYIYQGIRNTLTELEPGLFFSPYGDTINFRGRSPNFSNIPLIKIDPRTGHIHTAFYAVCGLVFLSTLLSVPLRFLARRLHRKRDLATVSTARPPHNSLRIWTELLAALASLSGLFYLILITQTPNMVYVLAAIPFPRPYVDLHWSQFAMLSLPYVSLVFTVAVMLMTALRLRSKEDGRAFCFYYWIVSLALVSFNLVILV